MAILIVYSFEVLKQVVVNWGLIGLSMGSCGVFGFGMLLFHYIFIQG